MGYFLCMCYMVLKLQRKSKASVNYAQTNAKLHYPIFDFLSLRHPSRPKMRFYKFLMSFRIEKPERNPKLAVLRTSLHNEKCKLKINAPVLTILDNFKNI